MQRRRQQHWFPKWLLTNQISYLTTRFLNAVVAGVSFVTLRFWFDWGGCITFYLYGAAFMGKH